MKVRAPHPSKPSFKFRKWQVRRCRRVKYSATADTFSVRVKVQSGLIPLNDNFFLSTGAVPRAKLAVYAPVLKNPCSASDDSFHSPFTQGCSENCHPQTISTFHSNSTVPKSFLRTEALKLAQKTNQKDQPFPSVRFALLKAKQCHRQTFTNNALLRRNSPPGWMKHSGSENLWNDQVEIVWLD